MMHCQSCGATTHNGLALCEMCRHQARGALEERLPILFRNLARQRRPARPNGSLGSRGQWLMKRGESEGSRVQSALDRFINDLVGRARMLNDDRDVETPEATTEAEQVDALCDHLARHLGSIATLDWAGDLVRELARHEKAAVDLTAAVVPGWYAGLCRQSAGRDMEGNEHLCETPIYVMPGMTWATCSGCHAVTHAADHVEVILEEASVWVAPPRRVAEALVALVDSEESVPQLHDRIRQWEQRGRLAAVRRYDEDGDPIGVKRYRLGEVLALVTRAPQAVVADGEGAA